jgi:hypothetical protein
MSRHTTGVLLIHCCWLCAPPVQTRAEETRGPIVCMSAEQLRDKIRGGLLGQILGNLNGLPHEFKYIKEPGNVATYTPALPGGARTDDDTDFEWVYIVEMQRHGTVYLSPGEIADLWKSRINRRIWCSNQYARQLMDLGIEPPLTGRVALNPWAEFNISGQFLCETFGLLAPAMPETAARIGLNYTTVAIDMEPAQTTQLFTTMIATAFVEDSVDRLLDAGLAALDPRSELHEIVGDLRRWHSQHPDDWRVTRRLLKEKYTRHGGTLRDSNGYELNTGSTIAALLYGQGDFAETLRIAFNFGWDADNNAATAGTVMGVVRGYRWMLAQGWPIVDRYENTTRDNMPNDETITSFADRLIDLADRVIEDNGGKRDSKHGPPSYSIRAESPRCVAQLPSRSTQLAAMRKALAADVDEGILRSLDATTNARAAYLAICLDMSKRYQEEHHDRWQAALRALNEHPNLVQAIYYHSNVPAGEALRERANAAGLAKPETKKPLW